MSKLISGYLWAFRNFESGVKSVKSLKKYYHDADIFINVDYDGDFENYVEHSKDINAIVTRNNFQLGYCGDFNSIYGKVVVGRECWPKEHTFEWMRGLYEACLKTDSKYILLLEEDDFVLKPISILSEDFSMAIHPTDPSPIGIKRANYIPNEFIMYSYERKGVTTAPGYGSGGGTVFNREHFIDAWQRVKEDLWKNYDQLKSVNKIIGWQDFVFQFIMMIAGYEIIQNHNLCEEWEVKHWREFEIVTGLKTHTEILL
jgi:hypothetical protein